MLVQCHLCFQPVNAQADLVRLDPCSCVFDETCLYNWTPGDSCPYCGQVGTKKEEVDLAPQADSTNNNLLTTVLVESLARSQRDLSVKEEQVLSLQEELKTEVQFYHEYVDDLKEKNANLMVQIDNNQRDYDKLKKEFDHILEYISSGKLHSLRRDT